MAWPMPKGLACWLAMSGLVARAFIIILLDNGWDDMSSAPSELKKCVRKRFTHHTQILTTTVAEKS
jgi:hypothetical protein